MGFSPWSHKEVDMTERLIHTHTHLFVFIYHLFVLKSHPVSSITILKNLL